MTPDWSPRAELGKILGLETDLSTVKNGEFLWTVVNEIGDALPDRVVPSSEYGAQVVIARYAKEHYGGYLDPIVFAQSADQSTSISTSLGGHPDVVTHFSGKPSGEITIRRQHAGWHPGKVELLSDEASSSALTYDEYMDALALDIAGACRELIDLDPAALAADDQRAIRIASPVVFPEYA